ASTESFFSYLENEMERKIIYKDDGVSKELLSSLILEIAIKERENVYIIWDIDSSVDKMVLGELLVNWEYIWYDTSDEAMVLYIPSSKVIIFITDHGYISYKLF